MELTIPVILRAASWRKLAIGIKDENLNFDGKKITVHIISSTVVNKSLLFHKFLFRFNYSLTLCQIKNSLIELAALCLVFASKVEVMQDRLHKPPL